MTQLATGPFGAKRVGSAAAAPPFGAKRVSPPPTSAEDESSFLSALGRFALGPSQGPVSQPGDDPEFEAARQQVREQAPAAAVEFQQELAQTAVGQTALRAEQGISNIATAGLSLASRGLGTGKLSAALHQDKAQRDAFLTAAEKGGQIESLLGESGNRIYNSVAGSIAEFGTAAVAGPAAVYSLIAGESFDDALTEAGQNGLTGGKAVGFAGVKAAVETGITLLMGKVGKRLGVSTFEESLSPGMRAAAAKLAENAAGKGRLSKVAAEAAGVGLEAGEELLIDAVNQGVELTAGTSKRFDFGRLLESGAAGAFARGVTGIGQLKDALRKLPSQNIEETVKGVVAAEELAGVSPISRAAGEVGEKVTRRFFENATPELLAAARKPMNQKEFAAATGLKKTSKVFRDAFRETLDLYASEPAGAVSSQIETPTSPAVASEVVGTTPDPSDQPAPQAASPASVATETALDPEAARLAAAVEPEVTTSARRADVDRDRELLGLSAIPDAQSRSWASDLDTARTNGVPGRASELASAVIAEPRAFSSVETAGVVIRAAELKNQHESLVSQVKDITDVADLTVRAAEIDRVEAEFDMLTQALRTSGTEKGRALAAQKLTINQDYRLLTILTRAKAAKVGALTPDERTKFEQLTEKAKRAQQRSAAFDARQEKRAKEAANREVIRLRGAVGQLRRLIGLDAIGEPLTDVPALTAADREALADLSAKLRQAEEALAAGPDLTTDERGVVHNRPSEKPVSDLDDAIARVKGDLKRVNRFNSNADERRRTESLRKKLDESHEILRKARAGEAVDSPRPRRADVMSEQRDKLHYELAKARQDIRNALNDIKPKTVWTHAQSATDLSLGLMTSVDYSALLRQGKFALWAAPRTGVNAIPAMFKAGWSPRQAWKQEDEIRSRENAHLYARSLHLDFSDTPLVKREENLASRILENIPIVAGSQRAYRALLNRLRADVFDLIVRTRLGGTANVTPQEADNLGHLINVFTGRGGFAAAEKHMRTAGLVLWSPRKLLGNLQFTIGEPLLRSEGRVRGIAAEMYLRSAIGAAAWYALYGLVFSDDPKFSITFDRTSPDFGKIKVGNTRFDPLAGLAQIVRFAGRMGSGQWTQANGRVKKITSRDKSSEIGRFLRGKLNPYVGHVIDVSSGENIVGEPFNVNSLEGVSNVLLAPVTPLSIRDFDKPIKDLGIPRGVVANILGNLGEGIQVYEQRGR